MKKHKKTALESFSSKDYASLCFEVFGFFTIQFVTAFLRRARWLGMWFPLAKSCYFGLQNLEGVHSATH